jgi:prepilin-type N-terminal cleavage/methylation domain-containing protein
MDAKQVPANGNRNHFGLQSAIRNPKFAIGRRAFTLVELLVVITIIGILASLITVAAAGALKRAHQAQIKTELNQLDMAVQTLRDNAGSYPPNSQTDVGVDADESIDAAHKLAVYTDLKRFFNQAFPRHREPPALIAALAGVDTNGAPLGTSIQLQGGMTAGEAIVFWLGGFSSDPKYPISGEGGPSYVYTGTVDARQDPITNRKMTFPFAVTRLVPRDATDGLFDETKGNRFITYTITINGLNQNRRINFWQYEPPKSEQPYVYFDVSRHTPDDYDPPAAPTVHVHALKTIENPGSANEHLAFANPDKFQIMHCGIDDEWGTDLFDHTSYGQYKSNPALFLAYPTGPFTGDVADTIVNFSEATLSASQK